MEFTESKFRFLQQEILLRHLGCWCPEVRTDLWIKWKIQMSVTMFLGDGLALLILQVPASWKRILLFSWKSNASCEEYSYSEIGRSFQEIPNYEGWSLSAQNSRLSSKMVRNFDQDERQADGAVHWNALKAVLTRGSRDRGAENFTGYQWWIFSKREARKWDSNIAKLLRKTWYTFVRFLDIAGGETMARDLMGHVLWPPGWTDIINHQGCAFNMKSIMANGLFQEETNQEDKQCLSLHSIRWNQMIDNMKIPRNFHYCSKWKHHQDAVYWVKIGRGTRIGITILANEVQRHHCIWKRSARLHFQDNCPKYQEGHVWEKGSTSTCISTKVVKDDSGSYAVFTEQGSSAFQMTAAKAMDVISRLPGCAGQAADAVSAYTQVKMEDAPNYWKFPNRNVQTYGFVYHETNGQNHGPVWKTQLFLLSGICTVILQQDFYGNLRKSCWNMVGWRFPIGNAYSYTVKKDYSYLCMWMTSNWLERNKI